MKKIWVSLLLISFYSGFAQESFSARVENETTGLPMPSVHILNLTQVIGTITNQKGDFQIPAKANKSSFSKPTKNFSLFRPLVSCHFHS